MAFMSPMHMFESLKMRFGDHVVWQVMVYRPKVVGTWPNHSFKADASGAA
jgi:hypothetical protein